MFTINYRLTYTKQDMQTMSVENFNDVEGFFQIILHNNEYGYYHNLPLRENEQGWYWLLAWFDSFLNAILELQTTDVIYINDIESYNTWIELKKYNKMLSVNIVRSEKSNGDGYIKKSGMINPEYIWEDDNIIEYNNFILEVISKCVKLLTEIESINYELAENRNMINIKRLLSETSRLLI